MLTPVTTLLRIHTQKLLPGFGLLFVSIIALHLEKAGSQFYRAQYFSAVPLERFIMSASATFGHGWIFTRSASGQFPTSHPSPQGLDVSMNSTRDASAWR
jgi:hypothetical protein